MILVCNTIELKSQTLNTIFEENVDLQFQFKTVKVAFQNPYLTLIPNLIYKEEEASIYLEKSFQIPQQHYLLTDNLLTFQCQNVYLAPIETYNFLLNRFQQIEFSHIATALLSKWQEIAVQLNNKSVFINVQIKFFQIAVFNREQLLIWNTFEYQTAKGFLYFVLLIIQQLKMNVETAQVFIGGELTKESEIYQFLFAYIRNIEFLKRTSHYQFDSNFDLQPNHANFDLFSI